MNIMIYGKASNSILTPQAKCTKITSSTGFNKTISTFNFTVNVVSENLLDV